MGNGTILNEFFLSGLSDLPGLQLPLFLFFLLIYLLTILWNLLIIVLIVTSSHLHVPMYFFLGNLAGLDLCCASVTVPRILFDLLTKKRKISTTACLTQVFFCVVFGISNSLLLAVMSFDRYSAICQPLHYTKTMSWKVCVQLVYIVWCLGLASALIHTLCALKLTFCWSDIIESFFCDLPELLRISCSDTFINSFLVFFLVSFFGGGALILTVLSYVFIFKTVLKMQIKGKRSKVFSTCISHLTVVSLFYGSGFFNYFQSSTGHHLPGEKVVPIFYTVIVPLLNPLIYSLRNQDFIWMFKHVIRKIFHVQNHSEIKIYS